MGDLVSHSTSNHVGFATTVGDAGLERHPPRDIWLPHQAGRA